MLGLQPKRAQGAVDRRRLLAIAARGRRTARSITITCRRFRRRPSRSSSRLAEADPDAGQAGAKPTSAKTDETTPPTRNRQARETVKPDEKTAKPDEKRQARRKDGQARREDAKPDEKAARRRRRRGQEADRRGEGGADKVEKLIARGRLLLTEGHEHIGDRLVQARREKLRPKDATSSMLRAAGARQARSRRAAASRARARRHRRASVHVAAQDQGCRPGRTPSTPATARASSPSSAAKRRSCG